MVVDCKKERKRWDRKGGMGKGAGLADYQLCTHTYYL